MESEVRVDLDRLAAELEGTLGATARALFAAGTIRDTLEQIVQLAVETIDGCDYAGVFLVRDERVATAASTAPVVAELDALQFAADEGPCLDAASEGRMVYADDLADDDRWPSFGPGAVAAGVRSVLAFRLFADETVAALNLYATLPAAYGALDRARGLVYSILAGRALGSAERRELDTEQAEGLQHALGTREIIGQAQGILMERERITAEQAFDVLRRSSQHLNLKLRDVAQRLVDTGESPEGGAAPAAAPQAPIEE